LASIAWGAFIYVPGDYPTIQAGIDAAVDGDTVLVADGNYTGEGNKNLDFNGKAITVTSKNGAESCIIDCEYDGRGFYFHSGETSKSVVSEFTIKNGSVDFGGAIYCNGSSPTIQENIITGNADTGDGGGGGIYCCYAASPVIQGNKINGNSARNGGGIYCAANSSPMINNNEISGNSVRYSGGGLQCWNSSPTIQSNKISGNSAQDGGGLQCRDSSFPMIQDNEINDNSAIDRGGGVYCHFASPTIQSNKISRNSAAYGGGINCLGGSPQAIQNNVIMRNSAGFGGGIFCFGDSSPTIINSTIVENQASSNGGGIYCKDTSSPTVLNAILRGDKPDEIYIAGSSTINITYSDIQGGWVGEGNIDADPLFVDAINGIYYLGDRSPCLGAGKSEGAPETDIVGRERGTPPDMGAYENPLNNPLKIGDVSGDRTISAYDAALILQYLVGLIDQFPATSPIGQAAQKYIAGEIPIDELDRILQSFGYPSVFKLLGYENKLLQNYPNPFNPETWIPFKLAQDAPVIISIYDTKGQLVRTISLGNKNAGIYTTKAKAAYWDGTDSFGEQVASGVYYYTLQTGEFTATRKMVIMK